MNQTLENILNLALETPEEERIQTENLNVGYEEETRSWELIVKYNGSLANLESLGIRVEELIAGYAILLVPENQVEQISGLPQIEYVEKPKRLFFAVAEGIRSSCILPVTQRAPFLSGEGVLVAVLDSGIDYQSPLFRKEDGSTRILYLWDQSVVTSVEAEGTGTAGFEEEMPPGPPAGFATGTEFTADRINAALASGSREEAYRLLPSVDVSGHGTAVAGIAAGRGRVADVYYEGVAPESDLIVVKLGTPGETSFPRTTELMRGLTYVVRKARELGRPVAINVSFGNTYGAHNGTSLLERFMDNVSEIGRNVICVGAGNEGASRGHTQGSVGDGNIGDGANGRAGRGRESTGEGVSRVELAVADYETTLNVQIWKNYVDEYRITLSAPGGQEVQVPTLSENAGKSVVTLENTRILIYLGEPAPYAAVQEIYFDFIPLSGEGGYIASGVWTFILEPVNIVTGRYYFYLPSAVTRSGNTGFYSPTPEVTLTIPSTAQKVITVGAYDTVYDAYADFSGRGYVYESRTMGLVLPGGVKPDLVAPGVGILVPDTFGSFTTVSGTSFATPFVTGAAALLMEWGIVQGNDAFLYGEKVKAYLRRGARPLRGETVYPNERVGYGALCVEDSLST